LRFLSFVQKNIQGICTKYFAMHRTLADIKLHKELAVTMNLKSAAPGEIRPSLTLSQQQLNRWFNSMGGTEKSATPKPLDTDDLKKDRLEWVKKWYEIFF